MDWSRGFTARYYATMVDPKSWRDLERFNIKSGSVKLTDNALRESADLDCREFDNTSERWIRIYLDARQDDGSAQLVPIFTGLASSPNLSFNGRRQDSKLQCYSVLKPAEDILLPLGWNINPSTNGARVIRELLSATTPAPIVIDNDFSPAVNQTIVAESGETNLSMVEYILSVIDWRIRIDGDGTIHICPPAEDPIVIFDADNYDVVELDVQISNNWYDCPNVLRVINNDMMAIAKDEDPNSLFSIQNRGREIWQEESSASLSDKETLGQYAKRRLKQLQEVGYTLSYSRRFHPDVRPSDLVYIRYPEQGIGGVFKSTYQTITIGYGARVSEESSSV